jgi:hypothetical protein
MERMLDTNNDTFEIKQSSTVASGNILQTFRQFLLLGVEHILTGKVLLLFYRVMQRARY